MITYNNNPYVMWQRDGCYQYTFTNVDSLMRQMSWTIEGEGETLSGTLESAEQVSITLDGDGIYHFSISFDEDAEVHDGYLIEICSLTNCLLKQYSLLYSPECKDGQLLIDPCDDCEGGEFRIAGLVRHYGHIAGNALTQASMLFIFYLAAITELHLVYSSLEVSGDEKDELVEQVKAMWEKLKAFTEACKFNCEENENCKNC